MKKKLNLFLAGVLLISLGLNQMRAFGEENDPFERGLTHYQNGDYELAIARFEEAKLTEPRNSLIYFYQGNAYYQMQDLDNAIITFTAGLGYTEDKGIFFYNLGNCYYLKGNYEFSTEMYAKALAYDPTLYDSYLNAGNAFYRAGNIEKTIMRWETYLEKYPETPQYENIERAIAYLRGEMNKTDGDSVTDEGDTGFDEQLLEEVLSDLDRLTNSTENIMEMSEEPVDDLSIEEIER
jgi:tetratricopeptide (TPR) repeat protein